MSTTSPPPDTLASEVEDARRVLLATARTRPSDWWTADELLGATNRRWRGTVFMIALDELLSEHELETNSSWQIKALLDNPGT